jgi:hypothetical protein
MNAGRPGLELTWKVSRMNRNLIKAFCVALVAANSLILARAEDGSTTVSPTTVMSVAVAPSAGAVVIEASTNLVDWTDVTMLFPSDGTGVFLDTQSTNYSFRFYRMRSIVSAANSLVTVSSFSDLRALSSVGGNADVTVRGYYSPGDGGGGQFYWDPNSTDNDDGGMTIVPTANPPAGRWKRTAQSNVNVKWFGAVGDGQVNDAPTIQAALDFADRRGGARVFLPAGQYLLPEGLDSILKVGDNTLVEGEGNASVILSKAGQAIRNKGSDREPFGNMHITIQNLTINCNQRGVNGIVFNSVTDSTIHNVRIIDPRGYGIWLFRLGDTTQSPGKPPQRITVSNCHVSGVVDTGIECSGAVGCTILGNTVTGTRGIAGYYAWNGATDCVFSGNVAEGEGLTNNFVGFAVQASDLLTSPTLVKSQTQRINFVGNMARNVAMGARVTGIPTNQPTDILFQGNSFVGSSQATCGAEIEEALRVTIQGNQFSAFENALLMNNVQAGFGLHGASYVNIDNNQFNGGGRLLLFGNNGGSLHGNRFFGQKYHAVNLWAWNNCNVSENTFINLGSDQSTYCIVVFDYNGIGATGNTFSGNKCMDDRSVKCVNGTIVFEPGTHERNIIMRNTAVGAKSGAKAFLDYSSGTNNIVANNIDG